MGPYHAIMVHFPVAMWIVASGIIVYRALSDRPLARALDRVLMTFLVIGVATGTTSSALAMSVGMPPAARILRLFKSPAAAIAFLVVKI